jgi:DNA mismatch repair protein MutL
VHNALQNAISYPSISITNTLREHAPAYIAESFSGEKFFAPATEPKHSYKELFPDSRIIPLATSSDLASEAPAPETSYSPPSRSPDCLQIGKSYIVCEQGGNMLIIDQHRAHKLILYERALLAFQNDESLASQELLFPENVEIPSYLQPILEAQKSELKKLGFSIEPFGSSTWRLRGIPAHLKISAAATAIIVFLQDAYESKESDMFKKNALSYANSSAIPSGAELSAQEMKTIVSDLLSSQNPYETPKGEAIFMKMPIEDIKRKFY